MPKNYSEHHAEGGKRLVPSSLERIMQGALFPDVTISASDQVLRVLQLNKDHQATVKTQIEQLESKLAALDKLLVRATSQIQLC